MDMWVLWLTSNDVNFDIPQSSHEYDRKHNVYNPYSKSYEETWLHNSSGILIHKLGKEWNRDFVLIFPLKNIPKGYKRADIEEAVGNLLIEKKSSDIGLLFTFILKRGK